MRFTGLSIIGKMSKVSKSSSGYVTSDILDVNQLFFVNLSLLGFDAASMERKHRIPFNKEMFTLPNKKGFETVIYFLFGRLDANGCKEHFRDCWPITDKKEEQLFRKVCTGWLEQISKDDPNAYLPRIGASLFMSPGGDKFCQFLFCFSRYVLLKVAMAEHGARCPADFQLHPMLTPQNGSLALTVAKSTAAGANRLLQKFIADCQHLETVQAEWLGFTDELVKEYRSLTKYIRDLERDLKSDMLKASECNASFTASPKRPKRPSGAMEYDNEIQTVHRTHAVQQLRGMWKSFEEFYSALTNDREVIESILHRTVEKYRLDATEQTVRLPDLLLRECEQEIHRRNVDNIYKEGKVNLLSLVHLSNLALHLYIEKMHEVGLPNIDDFLPDLSNMLQTHRKHLATAESHRGRLEMELLPEMRQSVDRLKAERDERYATMNTPSSYRVTSIGLGFEPPTPPVSFEPMDPQSATGHRISQPLNVHSSYVSTPDGASHLLEDVTARVQSKHSTSLLVQGSPVYGPRDLINRGLDNSRMESSRNTSSIAPYGVVPSEFIDVPSQKTTSAAKQIVPPKTAAAKSTKPTKVSAMESRHVDTTKVAPKATTVKGNRPATVSSIIPAKPVETLRAEATGEHTKTRPVAGSKLSATDRRLNVSVERHRDVGVKPKAKKADMDVLASRVADMLLSTSPDQPDAGIDSNFDPVAEMNLVMFRPGDKIRRTPPTMSAGATTGHMSTGSTWHDTLAASGGPLSSTHIDSGSGRSSATSQLVDIVDPVAVRLFSASASVGMHQDSAEVEIMTIEPNTKHPDDDFRFAGSNTPSSIHSISGSGESLSGSSIIESINGRTRDRVLGAGNRKAAEWKSNGIRTAGDDVGAEEEEERISNALKLDRDCDLVDDVEFGSLDETLRSLMETKTPMLPSRVRNASKPISVNREGAGSNPAGVELQFAEAGLIATGGRGDAEPVADDTAVAGLLSDVRTQKSFVSSKGKGDVLVETDSSSSDVDQRVSKVIEFSNGSYREFPENTASERRNVPVAAATWSSSKDADWSLQAEHYPLMMSNQSVLQDNKQLMSSASVQISSSNPALSNNVASAPRLDSASDINSLIARYRNLRATADTTTTSDTVSLPSSAGPTTELNNSLTITGSLPSAIAHTTGISNTPVRSTFTSSARLTPVAMSNISAVRTPVLTGVGDALNSKFVSSFLDTNRDSSFECGLDDDAFDDIRQNLVDVSLDDGVTPFISRLNKKDTSILDVSRTSCHAITMSPLTDVLHRTGDVHSSLVVDPTRFEISTRLSTSFNDDILREDGSLLVPSSPADVVRTPTTAAQNQNTATLVDLS